MPENKGTPISEITSHLESIERDASLYEEKNFARRIEAIDFIEFHLTSVPDHLNRLKSTLEEIDNKLFRQLWATIREEGITGPALKNMVAEYVGFETEEQDNREEPGYDNLDIFLNRLFFCEAMPQPTKDLEPDMVGYQKTPARIVFDLVTQSHFTNEDIFFDLGAGLGQVAILVHLLTGITSKGIEFEPAFCEYARQCATELHLSRVNFINADARHADYSEGTIFFMFTPFGGAILGEVLARLKRESLRRRISLITYGPCTVGVAGQSWLERLTRGENPGENSICPGADSDYTLTFFRSL